MPVQGTTISIMAGDKTYPAYLAVPAQSGKNPAIVLIHSFNGLEKGYKDMADAMAGEGFVVIAPESRPIISVPVTPRLNL